MTKEEIKQYIEITDKFDSDCERVRTILSESKKRCVSPNNITCANKFTIEHSSDVVVWEGYETWIYGGEQWHNGTFDLTYLTMTDEELHEIVKRENEEWKKEQEKREQDSKEYAKQMRRKQYEQLKKEFE